MTRDNKIRVLIVDDSLFMRRLIREIVEEDKQIEVIGEAKDGVEAIEKTKELKPDVVTMDYNMPEMDGAKATEKIMATKEHIPAIIILTGYDRKSVEEAMTSLRMGAVDFVFKPSGELSLDIETIKGELITKIKIASKAHVKAFFGDATRTIEPIKTKAGKAGIVVIGASTGGPPIVEHIITSLPSDFNLSILVVQHIAGELFSKRLAELIDDRAQIKVKEAEEDEIIKPGECLFAPAGSHMLVEISEEKGNISKLVHLNKEPKINGYRPSIDVLMKSVSERYSYKSIGVLLTGMGHDGALGMKAIKDAGGHTIVQKPETAVIDSMPLAAINAGAAKEVLYPEQIIKRLIELSDTISE